MKSRRSKRKVVRITTISISLASLFRGQLGFLSQSYEVIGISSSGTELDQVRTREGIKTIAVEMTRSITPIEDLRALCTLVRILWRERPDIVHTHTPKAGTLGMISAWICRVPVRLHTVAGLPLLEIGGTKRALLNVVERITYFCATMIYPNSFGLMEIIRQNGYARSGKLKVIGDGSTNGIDTEFYSITQVGVQEVIRMKAHNGVTPQHFVFIFIGRLVKAKGVGELVHAFVRLNTRQRNSILFLVGPTEGPLDPLDPVTEHTIASHPNIRSFGYQDDVRPFLAASNALVLASHREGLPNAPLQACAMGLPCVVSDINGCNEVITDGINGLVVPPKDSRKLEEAMERLVLDKELYDGLAARARDSIRVRYDQKVLWEAIKREYDEQLSTQR